MSNQCYLCCSDFKGIYPSSRSGVYDAAQHTVAVSVDAMPLLWLALFRVKDLKTESFADPAAPTEQITARAFVCRTQQSLTQLADALPVLNHLFAQYGGVDSHAAALAETLRAMGGKYVSMECEEIAMLHEDEDSFFAMVRRALRLFALAPEAVAALEVAPLQSPESAAPCPRLEGIEVVKFLRTKTGRSLVEIQSALKTFNGNVDDVVAHFERMRTPAERAAEKTDALIRKAMESTVVEYVPWKLLLRLCDLQLGRPFAKLPVPWADLEEADCRNLDHLLGSTHLRPVNWE